MASCRLVCLLVGLLTLSGLTIPNIYMGTVAAVERGEIQHSDAIYRIGASLVMWNGSGYLPVTASGAGESGMVTIGYDAVITNVSVVNQTRETCVVKVEYIITQAYGVNTTVNKTLEKMFAIDKKTNSFVVSNNTAFFPFYVCDDQFKYTYHFNEKVLVEKEADEVLWRNIMYEGVPSDLTFGPTYSVEGKDTTTYLCSGIDFQRMMCTRFDSQVLL
jgi:hypothetical protein